MSDQTPSQPGNADESEPPKTAGADATVQQAKGNEIYLLKDPAKAGNRAEPKDTAPADIRAALREARAGSADETPRDPTTAFQSGQYPQLVLPDVGCWVKRLYENRILVLSSADPTLMYAIAQAILLDPAFAACEKRDVLSQSYELSVDEFIIAAAGSKPRVLAAYAMQHSSAAFLGSLSPDGPSVNRTVRVLRERDIWLLIVTRTAYIEDLESQDRTQTFSYFEPPVDFLEPKLRAVYGQRAGEMVTMIRFQQQKELWPASEHTLLSEVNSRIKDRSLPQRVTQIDEAIQNGTENVFRDQQRPISAMQLLQAVPGGAPHLQLLYQWVMFVGTFFPEMPVREFSTILRILLPSSRTEPDAKEQGPQQKAPKPLFESWPLNEHAILTLCQMHQETEGRRLSAPGIQFIEPNLRTDMESAFRSAYYGHYSHALAAIEEHGLLLDPSPLVRNGVVELLATRAVLEPDYTGNRYVIEPLLSYIRTRTGDPAVPASLGGLVQELEKLSEDTRLLLLSQVASIIVKIAEKKHTAVAVAGLAQLQAAGLSGQIFTILRRGSQLDTPVEVLAEASRILLSTDEFVLYAATLKRVRQTICEPSKGSLLCLLLGQLSQVQGSALLRYLAYYTLRGYRSDEKTNPVAAALDDSQSSAEELKTFALDLLGDEFPTGLDEYECWDLFHSWVAPEVMRDALVRSSSLLEPAINATSLRLYMYLMSREADRNVTTTQWLAAMFLADTFIRLSSAEARRSLGAAIAAEFDKRERTKFASLLHEMANAINAAIVGVQGVQLSYDASEHQTRKQFVDHWKRLRDGLRLVKSEIESVQRPQSAVAGER